MGIANANKILAEHLISAEINIKDLDKSKKYDVAFDGSLLLFTGCTKPNLDIKNNYEKIEAVAKSAMTTVRSTYYKIKSFGIIISSAKIYFDGEKPSLKKNTSKNRQKYINFDQSAAQSRFSSYVSQKIKAIEIVTLRVGEAESEFFLRRSRCTPTIFCTNDTDMFHLTYKTIINSEPSCYMYEPSKRSLRLYDLKKLNIANLSKNIVKLILFASGSDFTEPIISQSMVRALLFVVEKFNDSEVLNRLRYIDGELENKYEEKLIKELGTSPKYLRDTVNMVFYKNKLYETIEYKITIENVERALLHLNRIFSYIRKSKHILPRFTYCHTNKQILDVNNTKDNCENYSRAICWSVNYSNVGCSVQYYKDENYATMKPIDSYVYYKYLKGKFKL